ncbi:polyphenol oxidase, chloroplastic-like [Humulus lupulus]|uniref:polyphenol oxidase, chloroplastic-like n=1 Tax=Humulus lupulus TaxID=3486 RepID=UPI002B409A92|nr:polyphenol oxidase, chloroplastic-like [Humulus lupulus]
MASFTPPVPIISTTTSFLSPSSFSRNKSYSYHLIPNYHRKSFACNATNDHAHDHSHNLRDQPHNKAHPKFDRRNVLIGLGGLYGTTLTGLSSNPSAFADPIAPPDLSKCGPADFPEGVTPTNCCPPVSPKIIDFKPPPVSRLRTRPAAHAVDDAYIAKYNRAIQLMKALPDSDPRSFSQQADIHCAYCDGSYDQVGFPDLELQVHNCWLFFPFHRYYLYFYERILAKLIDDPTFVLPFWNWDSPPGMQLPALYAKTNSPLYDTLRDRFHQPPTLVDLDYSPADVGVPTTGREEQLSINLKIMYREMVANGKNAQLFLGAPYRAGDEADPGAGSLETIPHGPVHLWTGDSTQPNFENMGNFYSAARDPIFFSHHSNVDRLWSVWKTLGGKRRDFTDPDWLDAGFLFYDENAQLVRVKVRDCLDTRKLGYVYQNVDNPWLKAKPTPRRTKSTKVASTRGRAFGAALAAEISTVSFPITLDKVISTVVSRPKKKKRSTKEKEDEEEVLVIDGIEFDRNFALKFDVYVNDEDEETPSGPGVSEFAGSFVNVPHKQTGVKKTKTCLRLGITDLLEDLEAEDDDTVVVTLVPKVGVATVSGIKIEFLS